MSNSIGRTAHVTAPIVAIFLAAATGAAAQQSAATALAPERSGTQTIELTVAASGLRVPSSIAFLPDGRALIADRAAPALYVLDLQTLELDTIAGLPPIATLHDAGLHDVVVDPQFSANGRIYFSYSAIGAADVYTLVVDRARLQGNRLIDTARLFAATPFVEGGDHFGGRLLITAEHLYITSGDRQHRELAQRLNNHIGKVLRLHLDGSVPSDNPFVSRENARPEIWSYGHRNPQGLAVHPVTGEIWSHEHGPLGGDEINVIRKGANYGWPVASFGFEYDGGPIGAGITRREGLESPVHVYVPSIAPSGLLFYTADAFPAWRDNLLIGALAGRHLNRVLMNQYAVRLEERLLGGRGYRIRSLAQAPDGSLLLGIDNGTVLRLRAGAATSFEHPVRDR